MIRKLALLVTLMGVASFAVAAPGSAPNEVDSAYYGVEARPFTWLLCDNINDTNNDTECKPAAVIGWGKSDAVIFSISKAQTNCEPGTISIQESDISSSSSPNVWHTVCSLTGVVTPLVSECTLTRRPKRYIRASLVAISDADCTEVDVMMEGQDLQLP